MIENDKNIEFVSSYKPKKPQMPSSGTDAKIGSQ